MFGCGADEILELVVKCFVGPGDEVVYAWPSFAMYPIVTKGMGGTVSGAHRARRRLRPRSARHGPSRRRPRTRVVFVCNPNNPTGTSVGAEAFDAFVASLPDSMVLVVDEAYFEFARRADFPDSIAWLRQRPGTLVMRTFSKIYGLAGLRIGYGIGDPELIGYLQRARHPFNVNRLAEAAALAALDDEEHARRTLEINAGGHRVPDVASSRRWASRVWPTDANFLLVRTGAGMSTRRCCARASSCARCRASGWAIACASPWACRGERALGEGAAASLREREA